VPKKAEAGESAEFHYIGDGRYVIGYSNNPTVTQAGDPEVVAALITDNPDLFAVGSATTAAPAAPAAPAEEGAQ
jgi:hypothetical protein